MDPFQIYNLLFSRSSVLPVSIIANCPGAILLGAVSAVNAATDIYVLAMVNPKPVSPRLPVYPILPCDPTKPVSPRLPVYPISP